MSLIRLAKIGFFKRANIPDGFDLVADYLHLNRSVLDKALVDSFSPNEEVRMEVLDWLDLDNPDFLEACDRALLDEEDVYASFKTLRQLLRGKNARFNTIKRPTVKT